MKAQQASGFTLTEVLVTLTVISIGMLALGSFYVSSISQEGIAQERLAAVHMAEQLIEDWQQTNNPPTPECTLAPKGKAPGQLVVGKTLASCTPNIGVPVLFDIFINEVDAKGPIPPEHANNPNASGPGASILGPFLEDPTNPSSASVKLRSVKVSWMHKNELRSVLLTHITRA
ncbi:MAG: hypothetical protein COS35_14170, partial [Zetaproteobacteria bacterium CG02_land_8_20_14_3_00_50_9]